MKQSFVIKILGRDSGTFKVTQIRSDAGRNRSVKGTVQALGLGKIGKSRTFTINPAIVGMVDRIKHLVTVE